MLYIRQLIPFLAISLFFLATPARAYLGDEHNIPGLGQLESLLKYSKDKANSFEAGLGYRMIDNDHFIVNIRSCSLRNIPNK